MSCGIVTVAHFYCSIFLPCSVESQEVFDAELSARILQLINVTDSGVHSQVQLQEQPALSSDDL